MKKLLHLTSIIVTVLLAMCLCSCNKKIKEVGSLDKGTTISSVEFVSKDGVAYEINKDFDPVLLYQLLVEKYDYRNVYYEFNYEVEFRELYANLYGILGRENNKIGDVYEENYYYFTESVVNKKVYSYVGFKESKINDVTKDHSLNSGSYALENKKILCGSILDENYKALGFKNKGDFVPANLNYSEGKDDAPANFVISSHRISPSVLFYDANPSGFYIEGYLSEFEYNIEVTDKYIIFSVKQPYGFDIGQIRIDDLEKGEFEKTIYYNYNTNKIDYAYTKANISSSINSPGVLVKYECVVKIIDKAVIDNKVKESKAFIDKNAVEMN